MQKAYQPCLSSQKTNKSQCADASCDSSAALFAAKMISHAQVQTKIKNMTMAGAGRISHSTTSTALLSFPT
jgi:hypothetical protein